MLGPAVDSKKLVEHRCRMIYAGASFLGLGWRAVMFQLSGLYSKKSQMAPRWILSTSDGPRNKIPVGPDYKNLYAHRRAPSKMTMLVVEGVLQAAPLELGRCNDYGLPFSDPCLGLLTGQCMTDVQRRPSKEDGATVLQSISVAG